MSAEFHPVVIIGAGPAGLAASMQLARQGLQPLVLERDRVGGLLWNANLVENYPGFAGGIRGPALVALFQAQAKALGVSIVFEDAQLTGFKDDCLRIATKERELAARVLVAATGTRANELSGSLLGPGVEERVYSEVYPLQGCRGKEVIIIGGGDAAFDYALNLSSGNQVHILNRGKEIKALPLLYDRVQEQPEINYQAEAELRSINLDQEGKLQVEVSVQGETENLEGDYLIAAIGREPEMSFVTTSIMNEIEGLIDKQRLYLIGDLKNGPYRQTAIAVGDGIRAAMEIDQYLSKERL